MTVFFLMKIYDIFFNNLFIYIILVQSSVYLLCFARGQSILRFTYIIIFTQ